MPPLDFRMEGKSLSHTINKGIWAKRQSPSMCSLTNRISLLYQTGLIIDMGVHVAGLCLCLFVCVWGLIFCFLLWVFVGFFCLQVKQPHALNTRWRKLPKMRLSGYLAATFLPEWAGSYLGRFYFLFIFFLFVFVLAICMFLLCLFSLFSFLSFRFSLFSLYLSISVSIYLSRYI